MDELNKENKVTYYGIHKRNAHEAIRNESPGMNAMPTTHLLQNYCTGTIERSFQVTIIDACCEKITLFGVEK